MIKAVLSESGDAISIDIISKNQYSCDAGNKFYPSKVHKGVMLEPIGKSQLFSKNEGKDDGVLEVSLGPIPSYVDTNNIKIVYNILFSLWYKPLLRRNSKFYNG